MKKMVSAIFLALVLVVLTGCVAVYRVGPVGPPFRHWPPPPRVIPSPPVILPLVPRPVIKPTLKPQRHVPGHWEGVGKARHWVPGN